MPFGFDVMQHFVNASAVLGISYLWVEFTKKAIKTQFDLWDSAFSFPKKKDDSSSDSNDDKELDENDINIDDDPSESRLEISVHISSPLFDEADVERLKHKGFEKALLEILNRYPTKKTKFGIAVKISSPFFDDDDAEDLKHKSLKKVVIELLNVL